MATVKIGTLLIRVCCPDNLEPVITRLTCPETIAKPISAQLKNQAKEWVSRPIVQALFANEGSRPRRHEVFRKFCVDLAQRMYRTEVKLRTSLLGEPAKRIRPLSEAKYVVCLS